MTGALDLERPPAARKVFCLRGGRGRTGGSTLIDVLVQRARASGRAVLVGDGDRRNPTLAGLYPPEGPGGATQPVSDETADVKDWITGELGRMVAAGSSLALDLGGGDRVMQEYGRDLGLVRFCARHGFTPVAFYTCGPDMDDFDHVLTVHRAGYFAPEASVLVFNQALVRAGQSAATAFAAIRARPEVAELQQAGMKMMLMPNLPCMPAVRAARLSFRGAAAGKAGADGKPFDPARAFMVEDWLDALEAAFADLGLEEFLP